MSKVIVLDDGHEFNTAGKRTPKFADGSFMHENEFNLAVKKYLKVELERNGFRTIDANPDRKETTLAQRVAVANKAKADLYISIHANAFKGVWGNAKGIETFVYKSGDGKRIGGIIHKHLLQGTKLTDRGVKDGSHLYVIKNTNMPAVLVECGFMDNLVEAKLLRTDAYRKECAVEIAKGICEAYGVTYKPAPAPKPTPKPAPASSKKVLYRVQVGAFGDKKNAEALAKELKSKGFQAIIKED